MRKNKMDPANDAFRTQFERLQKIRPNPLPPRRWDYAPPITPRDYPGIRTEDVLRGFNAYAKFLKETEKYDKWFKKPTV